MGRATVRTVSFSGLFAMERKGGMDEILAATPLGRKYTAKAKLRQNTLVAAGITLGTGLPHLWQILRDYGLPALLAPAMSISGWAVPKCITLSDLLLFWLLCRAAACLCMARLTLWLGQKLGNLLAALFVFGGRLLPARAAGAFGHEQRHRMAGLLPAVPRRRTVAKRRARRRERTVQFAVGADIFGR